MMKTFAERLRLVMGDASPTPWGMLRGIPPSTMDGLLNKGASPYPKTIEKLVSGTGISAEWWLSGDGDPPTPDLALMRDIRSARPVGAAVYNSESVAAQGQAQYQTATDPVASRIDGALLRQCWGACAAVHGEAFNAANQFQQLEHAVDLYNLLQRMAAADAQASLEGFARLDVGDLAQQLRIFIKMGRARDFSPTNGR